MSDGDTDQYNWSADDDRPLRELREAASPETRAPSSSAGGSGLSATRRGRRGGKRWRGGTPPNPPSFTTELQNDPQGWRKYARLVEIWKRLIQPYLPPEEQGLRLYQQVQGEAQLILEFEPLDQFSKADGVQVLLDKLSVHFDQRQVNTLTADLIQYESFGRRPNEPIPGAITRFQVLELRMAAHGIDPLPDKVRTVKLLRGMKLDLRGVQSVLASTGNLLSYNQVKTALVTLYPRGSPLAVAAPQEGRPRPRGRFQPRKGKGKGGGKAYSYMTEGQEADDADIQEIFQDAGEETNPQDAPEGIEEDAAEYEEEAPEDFEDAGGYDDY